MSDLERVKRRVYEMYVCAEEEWMQAVQDNLPLHVRDERLSRQVALKHVLDIIREEESAHMEGENR